MIKESIAKLVDGNDLSLYEMRLSMEEIMDGTACSSHIAAFLVALRMKGESVLEIVAAAEVMRSKASKINISPSQEAIDVVGTGGDGSNTFNISTTVALVLAAGGLAVAKHGNRKISSLSGSADVLRELGVNIDASKEIVEHCIAEANIGFLFAPNLHKAMKYASPIRKELGIRTIFNCLGPLTNPADVKNYLIGIYDKSLLTPLSRVLKELGVKRAMLVRGEDGLDEITTTTRTKIFEVNQEDIKDYYISPKDFDIPYAVKEELRGGNPRDNARILLDILNAKEEGAKKNIVLLNAGAAFYIGGIDSSIKEGIKRASSIIKSKKALNTLNMLIKISNKC